MTTRTPKSSTVKENLLLIAISLASAVTSAQTPPVNEPDYTKPALFGELPDTVRLSEADLLALFARQTGETAQIKMTGTFQFAGTVMGKTIRNNPERISLVVKSTNKQGAFLCLTKIVELTGNIIIKGRIISRAHIDCYDLVYTPGQGYELLKKNYYKLLSE